MAESNPIGVGIGIGFGIERSDVGFGYEKLDVYCTAIEYIARDSIPMPIPKANR